MSVQEESRPPDVTVGLRQRAAEPFAFVGCVELREILARKARDERELMEALEHVPAEAIYYHTSSVLLRRGREAAAYPNDFANWVASEIGDQVLAERLGMVDPVQLSSLEEVREEMVSVIESHIASLHPVPRVVFGDPFFFVQSHLVEVPTGLAAHTLEEFRRCAMEVDASAIYLHAIDARVRRGVPGGHFARWLAQGLGLGGLAERVARINPYLEGLEAFRARMLALLDAELATGGRGA